MAFELGVDTRITGANHSMRSKYLAVIFERQLANVVRLSLITSATRESAGSPAEGRAIV